MSIHHHHDHCHHHHHHHEGDKNLKTAFLLNFGFAILEVFGGLYTNSVAILSDAVHDFGDSMALLSALVLEKLSLKKPDDKYTFGYRRFSILAALINATILLFGSLFMIKEAVLRLMSPEVVEPHGIIFMAILGISMNGYAAYKLSKNKGINHNVVMWHLLEDVLGWVSMLVVSIILLFKPWYFLDSIFSIIISIVILRGVYKNLKRIIVIFLQKFPDAIDRHNLIKEIETIPGVIEAHRLKGFSIDESNFHITVHIVVPNETNMKGLDELKKAIGEIFHKHSILEYNLEFEGRDYSCASETEH